MSHADCPVKLTADQLEQTIAAGRLTDPWCRQRALEMLTLLEDVSWGRGGPDHYPAMTRLADRMVSEGKREVCREVGQMLADALDRHQEVFVSHIQTHNCATGDCVKLTPAPCQMACPAGIDIPSYVTLIGEGRDAEAIDLIRRDNPFPWVCGLVCTNPCEYMCVRGRMDEPVSIKYLKGFASERAMSRREYHNPSAQPDNHRKVAVIGAGPGGLTAAYYLALQGYGVSIYEGLPVAGGMMMVGIPRYRLPREVIDLEVAMIESLGVQIHYNTYLGHDVSIEELQAEGFESILLAMGAHTCLSLRIPGERDYAQVISAIDILRSVALGERHLPGRRIAVIGGGNVAIDAARTCLRLGAHEVTVVYRRTRNDMPANVEEVEQAEEEGIDFSFLTMPVSIEGQGLNVTGLKCLRTELGPPDDSGRRRPQPIEGSEYVLDVDVVVSAIGQAIHAGGINKMEGLRWSRRGTVWVNTVTMETSVEGIFACGDIVTGPATVIEAIGGGKKAADAIDRYLRGVPQPQMPPVPHRRAWLDPIEVTAPTKMILKRPHQSTLNLDRRRVTFQQVELGYTENETREEARRCLRCDICIRCGQCQEICRDKMKVDALKLGYLDFDHPDQTDFRVTAERCIACGACAANCPTGAMRMTDHDGYRVLSLCGATLNRLQLEYCESCGAVLGPARYHDFISGRTKALAAQTGGRALCVDCARKTAAGQHSEIAPPTV
jgi:NADPH-dependent glutamate synthase beta subunit-like oxidoreductase